MTEEIFRQERHLLVVVMVKYLTKTFFKGDRYRAVTWITSNNSHFSGQSPKELILNGRASKVWAFIESSEYDKTNI